MKRYKITTDVEYRSQSQRGGRPMVIRIPAGTIGEKHEHHSGAVVFPTLKRQLHTPFVWWVDHWQNFEEVPNKELTSERSESPSGDSLGRDK